MIECIAHEEDYVPALSFIELLSKFNIDSAKFYYAVLNEQCAEFIRCEDCDRLPTNCSCGEEEDDRLHGRYYREYDDDSDQT